MSYSITIQQIIKVQVFKFKIFSINSYPESSVKSSLKIKSFFNFLSCLSPNKTSLLLLTAAV